MSGTYPHVDGQTPWSDPRPFTYRSPHIGKFYRHRVLGCIVVVRGRGGFAPDTHWGTGRTRNAEKVYLNPEDGTWDPIDVGQPCPLCGIAPKVPQEWHHCDPVTRELHEARILIAAHREARSDAYRCDVDLAEQVVAIEAMRAEDFGAITPERAHEITQTLMRAAMANAEERNAVASQLADLRHAAALVCRHSWPDCDPDAVRDLEALRQHIHSNAKD